ncbi:hypothetical protein ACTMTI_00785 [Nonomuraea sp. H19]|uniref:hypothetical protein n=1 Tax=Nonomuraea sp. H19 TaxID=3452206 RepID=UPI003F89B220
MKRILAGLALASSAALMTGPSAQAAPVDPVKALKKQFVAGQGVRVSETARTLTSGKTTSVMRTTGAFEFGKRGVVAADLRNRVKTGDAELAALLTPLRTITVGEHAYAQGGVFSKDLPEGKKWVRYANAGSPRTGNQPLDIFEPKVLKALVSHAKSVKGGTYRGSVTFGDLGKIYGERIDKRLAKINIGYVLGLNSKGLVTEIRSAYSLDFGILGKTTTVAETRYTGWGAKITIKAPPADEVVDVSDLGSDTEVPQEIPDGSPNSFGRMK